MKNGEGDEFTALEWEQREKELDRAWYDADEEGNVRYGNDYDDFMIGGQTEDERKVQEDILRKKKQESQPISRRTLNSADHDKWEMNRMLQSGAVKMSHGGAAHDASNLLETDEERVILMVHDIKPPFLDGRIVFTTQTDPVQVVKDPNGDFY